MKTIFKVIIICAYLFSGGSYAQEKITELKIGDKVPDIVLKNVIGNDKSITLSSLHQQDLLIINFWATWCGACIDELPKLDSLVTTNKGKLKVLAVAYEKASVVNSFLLKHPEIKTSNFVMTTDDNVLMEYFSHHVFPHNVWIDRNGIVKYITGQEEVTEKNVKQVISQQAISLRKKTDRIDFDPYAPFHLSDSAFIYRSIFTGFIDGILGGHTLSTPWKHPTERWVNRIFCYTQSKAQLCWTAINELWTSYNDYGVMKIETNDSTRFFWPSECPKSYANSKYRSIQDWRIDNTYCYELSLPQPIKDSAFFAFMRNDLERMLQVQIVKSTEIMPTCVLTLQKGFTFKKPENDSSYIELTKLHLKAHNVSILHLFNFLNQKTKVSSAAKEVDFPYVDETGVKSNIDLNVDFNAAKPLYATIKNLISNKYGINFEVKKEKYPVYIIKDLAP